jgi:fumarate hydratase subunit alpha
MLDSTFFAPLMYDLISKAVCILPENVMDALESVYQGETEPLAKIQMETTVRHMKLSKEKMIPLCGDTGFPVFFVRMGSKIFIEGGIPALGKAIEEAVRKATEDAWIRPTVINPFTRENPGTNVGAYMPHIVYKFDPAIDFMELTSTPKGGGTEVFGPSFRVLLNADGIPGIKKFVFDSLVIHGNKTGGTCPPNIVGVGIGGTSDLAMKLAKEAAVLRKIGDRHPEENLAKLELELLEALNMTGVGPLGMGGKAMALDVHIEYAMSHLAGFSAALSVQCPAARVATIRVYPDGRVEDRDWPEWFKRDKEAHHDPH